MLIRKEHFTYRQHQKYVYLFGQECDPVDVSNVLHIIPISYEPLGLKSVVISPNEYEKTFSAYVWEPVR